MTLQIEIVPILSDNYVYLVRDEASGRVACVDPGEAAPVLAAAEEKGWEIDTILITHHHGDHVGGVATIKAATGATVIGPGGDSQPIPGLDQSVADGDVVEFGYERLAVIGVYGHTAGHITFHARHEGALFAGDAYRVVAVSGDQGDRILAFEREQTGQRLSCAFALRTGAALLGAEKPIPHADYWGDTRIAFTSGAIAASDCFAASPVHVAIDGEALT